MEVSTGSVADDGRRAHEDRRTDGRAEDRRTGEDRRDGAFARWLVGFFASLRLTKASDWVKVLKASKALELVVMLFSGTISTVAYSFTMGFWLATGFVVVLGFHEFGHYAAARFAGLRPRMWMFIPFFGAIMGLPDVKGRNQEAIIAFGGPLLGGVISILIFVSWLLCAQLVSPQVSQVWYTVGIISTVLNLFNLIPLSPLDGGRITQATSWHFPKILRFVGFGALVALSFYFREASMLLVFILVIDEVRMSMARRFHTAALLCACMPVLALLGWHTAYWWQDLMYFFVAIYFVRQYYKVWRLAEQKGIMMIPVHEWRNHPLPKKEALRWTITYFGSVIVLSGLLMLQFIFGQKFLG